MLTLSGVPRMVWPGKRTSVVMWTGPYSTRMVYTWNPWEASLCEEAYQKKLQITMRAEQTLFGWKIAHVALDEPVAEQAPTQEQPA